MRRQTAISLLFLLITTTLPAADSVIVFSEIHYHPPANEAALEWVELHSQMAVDTDISAWTLGGGIDYTFPEGTVLTGGGYLVVAVNPAALASQSGYAGALGPFASRLSNSGELLELRDRNGRLMDAVDYKDGGKWPAGADGSGATLAKLDPNSPSDAPEYWGASWTAGGTPGARNFPDLRPARIGQTLVGLNAPYRYLATGVDPGEGWPSAGFDDHTWPGGNPATLVSYWPLDGNATAVRGRSGTLNNGVQPGPDRAGRNSGALAFNGALQQSVIIPEGGGLDGKASGTISLWVKWTGQQDADCCGTFGPILARQSDGQFSDGIIALSAVNPSNAAVVWRQSGAPAPTLLASPAGIGTNWHHLAITFSPAESRLYLDGVLRAAARGSAFNSNPSIPLSLGAWSGGGSGYLTGLLDDVAIWDQPLTPGQIADLASDTRTPLDFLSPDTGGFFAGSGTIAGGDGLLNKELPLGAATYFFRHTFEFGGDPQSVTLELSHAVDDGAVFYLNGQEIQRVNLPAGPINITTPASTPKQSAEFPPAIALPATSLLHGSNVFAVEVHQGSAPPDPDMVFAAVLRAVPVSAPGPAPDPYRDLVLNEVLAGGPSNFTVELYNRGSNAIALGGCVIARRPAGGSRDYILPAQTLGAGAWLQLSQSQLGFGAAPGDKLFLYAPGQAAILDALDVSDRLQARVPDGRGRWLFPSLPTPGAANQVALRDEIVINEILYHAPPTLARAPVLGTNLLLTLTNQWRYEQSGADLGTAWRAPNYNDAAWLSGTGLLQSTTASLPAPKGTGLILGPTTYYFRTTFEYSGTPRIVGLNVRHVIDDGAVFYLNGVEVLRVGMPAGVITNGTLATTSIVNATLSGVIALAVTNLPVGTNVLAVEVHQAATSRNDVVFGAELTATVELVPGVSFAESPEQWVELYNRSSHTVDLGGWALEGGIDYTFPAATSIAAGNFLVVAWDPAAMQARHPGIPVVGPFTGSLSRSADRLVLRDPQGNPADETAYFDGGRWPQIADGGGSSLELRNTDADHLSPEAWAASDERARGTWQVHTYRAICQPSAVGPDGQWREFVMGLLGPGEVWLDDLSVLESPSGASPVELIQNGTFGSGTNSWRIIGNHRGEIIEDPEQPGNNVLRLVSTGETDHMSNHAETTLANNRDVLDGREYQIRFRAKWISGSRQFHTRLYFNRMARTTELPMPAVYGTPGAVNSRFTPNLGPTYREFRHEPVVPEPYERVTVSVVASDPDGLASLPRLWRSVNGGGWTWSAMNDLGGGVFRGTLAGADAGAVVQFYVEAQDTKGASSTFPAAGPDSRALFKVNDGLAATNGLLNVRIITTPADGDRMHATINLMSNARTGCTVIYDERDVVYDAAVRLKGSEHSRTTAARLGFDLDLPPDQRFRGIHRTLGIDRSESVGFGQREMLIHQTLNHAGGLPTKYHELIQVLPPRREFAGSAELQLARYTDVFLDAQYPQGGDGTVFEYELVYQLNSTDNGLPEGNKVPAPDSVLGTTIRDLGPDKESYRWNFLIKNNEERDDYSRLMEFCRTMGLSGAAFNTQITNVIDVEQWLRAYALCNISGAGDNYGSDGSQHNVRFYVRPTDQKVLFLPHDVDAFFDVNRPIVGSTDLSRLLSVGSNARSYYRHARDILTTTYNGAYLSRWAAHYGRLLPAQDFPGHLAFINQRSALLMAQVNQAAPNLPFAITSSGGRDFVVSGSNVAITGSANLDVKEIFLAGNPNPLPVVWQSPTGWQTPPIPLQLGTNLLVFTARDFNGQPAGTDSITVAATLPGGLPDSDGDGMPDVYETEHQLDPQRADGAEDPDGDGLTNYQEFLAGTDPRDGLSQLELDWIVPAPNTLTLSFAAVPGRTYSLQVRDDPRVGNWIRVTNVVPRVTNRVIQVTLPTAGLPAARFFRLTTPQVP